MATILSFYSIPEPDIGHPRNKDGGNGRPDIKIRYTYIEATMVTCSSPVKILDRT
jgi:hypothetical protein